MILLRMVFILTAIALLVMGGMYMLTRDPRYPRIAKQILRFVVFLLLMLGAMLAVERILLRGGALF